MKKCVYFIWLALFVNILCAQQTDVYEERVTSAGNIASTISNLGLVGNSFGGSFDVLGYPSMEYPVGSGIEHVFEGGLWVGGLIGGEIAVSTAAVDDSEGYSDGKIGFEFTSKAGLEERSILFDSPFFSPDAVSHQDFVSTFTDTAEFVTKATGTIPIQEHETPLNLKVEFESYNWNFAFANFFVILNFRITNIGNQSIDSAYIGYWIDGVVRNVNITAPGGSAFYNKGGNGFIDSLNMCYEFDAIGDIGYTDSYVATKFLGANFLGGCTPNPALNPNLDINFNTWQFRNAADPLYFYPVNDFQKYNKMTTGLNSLPAWEDIQNTIRTANNRSNLISVGPFSRINPGEYVDIAFAIVCARRNFDGNPAADDNAAQKANLIQNAQWAQTAYDGEDLNQNGFLDPDEDRDGDGCLTRFILPSPPDPPKMKVVADDHKIEVYWSNNSEFSEDPISKKLDFEGYRIYKTKVGFDVQNTPDILQALSRVGEWDEAGNELFFETGLEAIALDNPVQFEGDTLTYYYKYTFDNIANGWQHVVALTAFDEGDEINNLESLESSQLANMQRVFAGKPANTNMKDNEPFVYPNPYYAHAAWEGASSFEEDRKIIFANLPKRCNVRIYTLAGDLVDVFEHDEAYDGSDIRWYDTYSDSDRATFSGGEHAWDLLSKDSQIISRGLYLFVVVDLDSNEKFRGKFVVIK